MAHLDVADPSRRLLSRARLAERHHADAQPAPITDEDVRRVRDRLARVTKLLPRSA